VREAELAWLQDKKSTIKDPDNLGEWGFVNAAARAAALLSFALPLEVIVAFTRDGRTADLLSEYRPRAPIVAITATQSVAQQLALEWGVTAYVAPWPTDVEDTVSIASAILEKHAICKKGDPFALIFGWPLAAGTNTVKLHRL
jgi:pyruvate kinase